MKKIVWFAVGTTFGFVLAHFVAKDPRGREVLADVDARIAAFTDRVGESYREQEARLAAAARDALD